MIERLLKEIRGKWIFLIIVIVFYLILLFTNFHLAKDVFIIFLNLLQKIIPIFILVFILIFFSNLFLDSKKITKLLGEGTGFKGWFISIVGGILSIGPIYMWYPILSELREKGMKDSFIATFLSSRAIKIPLIPMMIYYFGSPFTIVLTFYMVLFSIINGILVEKVLKL